MYIIQKSQSSWGVKFKKVDFYPFLFEIELEFNLEVNGQLFNYKLASVIFHHGLTLDEGHYSCKYI